MRTSKQPHFAFWNQTRQQRGFVELMVCVCDRHEYREEKAHAFEALAGLVARIVDPQANVVAIKRLDVEEGPAFQMYGSLALANSVRD